VIKEIGCLQEAIITILAEDGIAFDTPYIGRFGLSMLLELNAEFCQKLILYDTNSATERLMNEAGTRWDSYRNCFKNT
jgi:metal-dependent hydrolase (beta-lactamase superfamily II)